MELIENKKKYWEFIRNLRNHEDVKIGFIQQENITQSQIQSIEKYYNRLSDTDATAKPPTLKL